MAKASSKSDQVLAKEEYPEPKTKVGFPALVREILDLPGGVSRIVLEKGQPVRVWRWVDKTDLDEEGPTLDAALANSEIIEYINPDTTRTAPEELFHMMAVLTKERHLPVCWATGRDQNSLLRKWLRVDEQDVPWDGADIFGVPVERLKSLPEDTLLLCGAAHVNASIGDVTLAVKTAIELREKAYGQENVERDVVGSGDPPEERSVPTRETSPRPSRDNGEAWQPPRFLRSRFGRRTQVR